MEQPRTIFDCAVVTLDGSTVLRTFGTSTKARPETVARHASKLLNVLIKLNHIPVTGEHMFRAEWTPMCMSCCRSVKECGGIHHSPDKVRERLTVLGRGNYAKS